MKYSTEARRPQIQGKLCSQKGWRGGSTISHQAFDSLLHLLWPFQQGCAQCLGQFHFRKSQGDEQNWGAMEATFFFFFGDNFQ